MSFISAVAEAVPKPNLLSLDKKHHTDMASQNNTQGEPYALVELTSLNLMMFG